MAGVYQWLPIKNMCLTHATPLNSSHGIGPKGQRRIPDGVRHGLFCVGCCWALMALLFVVGVMNLIWWRPSPDSCWSKSSPQGRAGTRGGCVR